MQHGDIQGHIHLRQRARRLHAVRHAYPSSNRSIRLLDGIMYGAGVVAPLVSIPQLLEIYKNHNAAGISVLTWSGYTLLSVLWLTYGVVHREQPIIVAHALWLLVNVLVVIGAILY